ncbi:MAG: SCP2 sterol-binding domain-containing protein [Deltaproteobacteria bacterium]|nr:SCP2 sterol-binding domain-containing protein [Deltaproteobacteria bacterium]
MDPEFQAARFFEAILPLLIADAGPRASQVDAVVRFDLVTGESSRSFSADLREGRADYGEGLRVDADLVMTVDENLVLPLLLGELDVELAMESGLLAVSGNLEVLERWSRLFGDSFRGLGTLIASRSAPRTSRGEP